MELKLAQGESIAKSWDYAISGGIGRDKRKRHDNLTITNKRIIHTAYSELELEREEVYVKDAKTISGKYARNGKFLAILKLIVGIPLCLLIVGIKIVKSALDDLRACTLTLDITTAGSEGTSFSLAASAAILKRFTAGTFKVKVKKEMAREIVDEIGALVLDAKAN